MAFVQTTSNWNCSREAAESMSTSHCSTGYGVDLCWNNEAIAQTLMVALQMVMRNEFSNGISQRIFTKQDHPVQTAFFDGTDESFRIGI